MIISFDTPCFYFTSVTHKRLPIFRTDKLKQVLCNALNEARKSSGMSYFSYAIMPDHLRIVTGSEKKITDSLRYINGVTAKHILDHLKRNNLTSSIEKLRQSQKKDGSQYSVWEHHSDKFIITSESMFRQKVQYIHNNPVNDGLVELPDDYLYSSIRFWKKKPLDIEPLEMDLGKIRWRLG